MPRSDSRNASRQTRIDAALKKLIVRMTGCRDLRKSSILIRTVDGGGRAFYLDCSSETVTVTDSPSAPPTIEIVGNARNIESLLLGRKDPRKLFLAGALSVGGDLRYL